MRNFKTHAGGKLRIVRANCVRIIYSCKSAYETVFRTNASTWFNSLNPACVNFELNGNNSQRKNTKPSGM